MRDPDLLITLNRELIHTLFRLPGKPTFSTAAGKTLARSLDVTPRTGKQLVHVGAATLVAMLVARALPPNAQIIGGLGIGMLAYAFLESFDPSR